MKYPIRIFVFIITSVFVNSCTMRALVLDNAEWFAYRLVDDFFDITEQQSALVEKDINEAWLWLRGPPSKDLLAIFDATIKSLEGGLKESDVGSMYRQLRELREKTLLYLAPAGGRFLSRLSERQVKHFESELLEKHKEDLELLDLNDAQYVEKMESEAKKRIERFYGSATKAQISMTIELFDMTKDQYRKLLQQRRMSQQNFLSWLRTQPSEQQATDKLKSWIQKTDLFRPKEMAEFYRQQRSAYQRWWWEIDKSVSATQKKFALDFLIEWRDSLATISLTQQKR